MTGNFRKVREVVKPQPVVEGAGVHLIRSIATPHLDYLDPFLLFDHFGSDNPEDYLAGFPMHPHRGIETVTYMLSGEVAHRDSLNNAGVIGAGDVQWMTAGRGILHEEMPAPVENKMEGFQLWVNLPAALKMTKPRYQEVLSDSIPEVDYSPGVNIRVIAGEVNGITGPVKDIFVEPDYLDVRMAAAAEFEIFSPSDFTTFVYLYRGSAVFGEEKIYVDSPHLIIFTDGEKLLVRADQDGARFLLVMGKPLFEPIARYGPFVMNTREEIMQTLKELKDGTFIIPQA